MDLYALPPEEFTAARDTAARSDKALKVLRRPTVSAWVVNTLVRRDRELLEQLLALGPQLASAQQSRDATALRALGEQRRALLDGAVRRAVELVGRSVTAAVREEVAGTLEAALADPASAEAVRSGRLVRPLTYAGFGEVDLEGAVAARVGAPSGSAPSGSAPSAGARSGARSGGASDGAARPARGGPAGPSTRVLERAARDPAGALDDAARVAEQAARESDRVAEEAAAALAAAVRARQEVEAARRALAAAREAAREATARHTEAGKRAKAAERDADRLRERVHVAQQAAGAARSALDGARRR